MRDFSKTKGDLLLEEAEAIRRCQSGERDAFRLLVEQYEKVLYGTAFLMTRDDSLSEEFVQEAFLRAWRGIPSFRLDGSFKAWILRILVNQVMTNRRKLRVPESPLTEGIVPIDISRDIDVEELVLKNEERQQIRQSLELLPQEQRYVVVLRYFADLTVPEIAKVMGCREGTIKSRLHRALARLRELSIKTMRLPTRCGREGA